MDKKLYAVLVDGYEQPIVLDDDGLREAKIPIEDVQEITEEEAENIIRGTRAYNDFLSSELFLSPPEEDADRVI